MAGGKEGNHKCQALQKIAKDLIPVREIRISQEKELPRLLPDEEHLLQEKLPPLHADLLLQHAGPLLHREGLLLLHGEGQKPVPVLQGADSAEISCFS